MVERREAQGESYEIEVGEMVAPFEHLEKLPDELMREAYLTSDGLTLTRGC